MKMSWVTPFIFPLLHRIEQTTPLPLMTSNWNNHRLTPWQWLWLSRIKAKLLVRQWLFTLPSTRSWRGLDALTWESTCSSGAENVPEVVHRSNKYSQKAVCLYVIPSSHHPRSQLCKSLGFRSLTRDCGIRVTVFLKPPYLFENRWSCSLSISGSGI